MAHRTALLRAVVDSRAVTSISFRTRSSLSQAAKLRPPAEVAVTQGARNSLVTPQSLTLYRHRVQIPHRLTRFHSNSVMADGDALLAAMADDLDGIDDSLRDENLRVDAPWGLAVYRVSYSDDAAWQRMLARIETDMRERLELQSRDDLLARHDLVVMDDRAKFDGLKPYEVRELFTKWAVEELGRNWVGQPILDANRGTLDGREGTGDENTTSWERGPDYFSGARYNYCLVVDDLCLESLDKMPTGPVIKLLRKDFSPLSQDEGERTARIGEEEELGFPGTFWEDGVTGHEEEDVGWMYIPVVDYVEQYNALCDGDNWYEGYVRPPFTFHNRRIENAVGFWRTTATATASHLNQT
ncbi:hypothetical protein AAE478_008368 [Parahypoxylon ruwenzoriense]